MLFDYLKHAGVIGSSNISETLNSVKLKLKLTGAADGFVLKLFDELKTLSNRDKFELFLEVSGNHVAIKDCTPASLVKIQEHLEEFKDENEFEIELNIEKIQVNSKISIYFIEEFGDYLKREKLLNLINTFSIQFEELINFEVFSTIESFGTATILFSQAGTTVDSTVVIIESSRHEKLELLSENATSANIKVRLLPSDFYLTTESQHKNINNFFKKVCAVLSLIFISNSSELNTNDCFSSSPYTQL